MTNSVLYFHSVLRYFVLLFAIIVVVQSLLGVVLKKDFNKTNKIGAMIMMIVADVQLLLGLVLYMTGGWLGLLTDPANMKVPAVRFFTVEHSVSMLIAIILIHVGYSGVKKNIADAVKFRRLLLTTAAALLLMLSMIPWQGKKDVGRPNIPQLGSRM
jgi:hypothetical protein